MGSSSVVISSFGVSYKTKIGPGEVKAATITGYGHARSTDLPSLRNMSEDLTPAVNSNNHRVYKLMKGD